jgi:hypothetical protein
MWPSTSAHAADPIPSLDLRRQRIPLAHDGGLYLEPVASPDTGELVAAVRSSYAFRSVVLRDTSGEVAVAPLEHQLSADVAVSIGLFRYVTVGLDLPVVIAQTGDDTRNDEQASRLVGAQNGPPLAALGDPALRLKGSFLTPEADETGVPFGFGLGLDERLSVPLGNERSFVGEGAVTSETRLLIEGALSVVSVHVAAGIKVRASEGAYACDPDLPESSCPSRFGHELPFGVGLAFHPQALGIDDDGVFTGFAEVRGAIGVSPVDPTESFLASAVIVSGAARVRFGDLALLAGVEAGVSEGIGVPTVGGTIGVSFAPRHVDADEDGRADEEDPCPTFAEDKDGFEDADGCPEADNDSDGVPDALDECRDQPGKSDARGCPG